MLRVRLRSIADAELGEATKWYAARSRDVASRFLDAVDEALDRIRQAPDANPLVTPTLRRILLRRFPYKIFYQIIGDRVVIFRVLHAKQEHGSNL